jgi:hypothetical protein
VPKGGLGFFNLQCFLDTQRCTWLLRAKRECIDNWRYDLLTAAPNNDILLLRKDDIEEASHPILYNFCYAFDDFYVRFCRECENYYHAQIYDNAVFRDPDSGSTLNKNFFGINFYTTHKNKIRKLKFSDCFTILGFKTLAQFRDMDLPFTMATWMRIRNALLHFRGGIREMPKKPTSILDFVNSWKKGGKKLRTIVNRVLECDIKLSETRCFLTFSGLIDLAPDPDYDLSAWLSAWNITSLTNNLRVFIFNCRYNSLPLNNRLNAYMPEINPLCTFCRVTNNTPVPRDSLLHCFYNCPYAQLLISHLTLILTAS